MSKTARPRRFMMCGVPVTYELVLRVVLLLLTVGALIAASIPKVKSILGQANVVSVTMTDNNNINAPGTLVCAELMDSVEMQMVTRGIVYANGTLAPDLIRDIPSALYTVSNASTINLRPDGGWPTVGKCVILSPKGLYFAKNLDGSDTNAIDTMIFVIRSKVNYNSTNDNGLAIAIWDGNVPMVDQRPIWTGIPSLNTLTFVYEEHILLDQPNVPQTHYTIQKQNLRTLPPGFFADQTVIGQVVFSPDTFFVTRYLDKQSYTWVDLLGAFGGMASIAIAVWIFLFGSGKYKSWGVMQRYILRTSPDSGRFQEKVEAPKNPYESVKYFFKAQLSRMDSSADDMDAAPLQPTIQERRRLSTRYSTPVDMNTAAAVATGVSAGKGPRASRTPNLSPVGAEFELAPKRYSIESGAPSNFYFSELGTPVSRSLQPLAPINEDGDDAEEQVSELIRLIDLRVDERMWSLERTLSRYYLDGFRLRDYSAQYNSERYYQQLDSKDEAAINNNLAIAADRNSQAGLSQGREMGPLPGLPPAPSYPPRPKLNQQYEYIDEADAATAATPASPPGKQEISEIPSIVVAPPAQASPSSSFQSNNLQLSPGFPQRRDMRGTIRRAVERLQNEWPQGQAPVAGYVPRTQYQDRNDAGSPDYNLPRY